MLPTVDVTGVTAALAATQTSGTAAQTGLLFGLILAAAIAGGYVSHMMRIPRVVGYLLAGAMLRVVFSTVLQDDDQAQQTLTQAELPLKTVKDLALGLILFAIGGIFDVKHIRAIGSSVGRIALANAALTAVLVFLAVFAAAWSMAPDQPLSNIVAVALLLALASISTAPAATLFTLREYEAKGTTTDVILATTGINVVICLASFYVAFLLMGALGTFGSQPLSARDASLGLLVVTAGSVALGVGIGFVISVAYARLPVAETLLILIAAMIVLSSGERWLLNSTGASYSFLLTALCVGTVFSNISPDPDRLESAIKIVGPPLFVGFFALAGFQLHLEDLRDLGGIGIAYVVARTVGKLLGGWAGARWSGMTDNNRCWIGGGLLCQAAVVVSLADLVSSRWSDPWASRSVVTTLLGSAVVFESCGPLVLKWLVVRSGEVKAVSLLRHSGSGQARGRSITALMAESLLRMVGLARGSRASSDGPLRVRHLMRANVKCIPAAAPFDEVLHLIERSPYHHFPVIDPDQRLVGVIHYSDMRDIIHDPTLYPLVTAADLAETDTRSVSVDTSLDDALDAFQKSNVGSLPVVDDPQAGHVVGIIEQRDLLRTVRSMRADTPADS